MRDFKSFFLKRVPQKDRFLQGDKPTQDVFTRLFDSVGFISEKTDAAKTTEQGFVKLADNNSAKYFTTPGDGFSYAVQPDQLPETKELLLGGTVGDPYMPLSTIEVLRDFSNPRRVTFFLRLKKEFVQWLVSRLLPGGGTPSQILRRGTGANFTAIWDDKDKLLYKVITGMGIDYAYYTAPYYAGGRKTLVSGAGILTLDVNVNAYLLQGNPDPYLSHFNAYGEYNRIEMAGVTQGYRLRLKYTGGGSDNFPMAFFEAGVFAGNIDLGTHASIIGGRRGILVNKGDALTFIYGPAGKWILWEINTPTLQDTTALPTSFSYDFLTHNVTGISEESGTFRYIKEGRNMTIYFDLRGKTTNVTGTNHWVDMLLVIPVGYKPQPSSIVAGSYQARMNETDAYTPMVAATVDANGNINQAFDGTVMHAIVGQKFNFVGFISYKIY